MEEERMFCSSCGNQLDDQAVICPKCGVPTQRFGQVAVVARRAGTNGLAIASFICSLVGLGIGSLLAIIFGHIALARIRSRGQGGKVLAIVGLILGYIGVAALAAWIVITVAAVDSRGAWRPRAAIQPAQRAWIVCDLPGDPMGSLMRHFEALEKHDWTGAAKYIVDPEQEERRLQQVAARLQQFVEANPEIMPTVRILMEAVRERKYSLYLRKEVRSGDTWYSLRLRWQISGVKFPGPRGEQWDAIETPMAMRPGWQRWQVVDPWEDATREDWQEYQFVQGWHDVDPSVGSGGPPASPGRWRVWLTADIPGDPIGCLTRCLDALSRREWIAAVEQMSPPGEAGDRVQRGAEKLQRKLTQEVDFEECLQVIVMLRRAIRDRQYTIYMEQRESSEFGRVWEIDIRWDVPTGQLPQTLLGERLEGTPIARGTSVFHTSLFRAETWDRWVAPDLLSTESRERFQWRCPVEGWVEAE